MSDLIYQNAIQALALMIRSVCEDDCSPTLMHHLGENDLDVIPDMLSRLGVMRPISYHSHEFTSDWNGNDTLSLLRHDDEPTNLDIGRALDFCTHWYQTSGYGNDNPYKRAIDEARQAVIDVAVTMGRGTLTDGDYHAHDTGGEDILDYYWKSRSSKWGL